MNLSIFFLNQSLGHTPFESTPPRVDQGEESSERASLHKLSEFLDQSFVWTFSICHEIMVFAETGPKRPMKETYERDL